METRTKRVYVSGPMTGISDFNFPAFADAAALLRGAGHDVVDPSEKGVIDGWSWTEYLRFDLHQLLDCDGVATLPGWEHSKGACLECFVASELGMPVRPIEEWL